MFTTNPNKGIHEIPNLWREKKLMSPKNPFFSSPLPVPIGCRSVWKEFRGWFHISETHLWEAPETRIKHQKRTKIIRFQQQQKGGAKERNTVDGRNPAPAVGVSHYLNGFLHPRRCRISSINSILKNHCSQRKGKQIEDKKKPKQAHHNPWYSFSYTQGGPLWSS